jgi:hypothetical protein
MKWVVEFWLKTAMVIVGLGVFIPLTIFENRLSFRHFEHPFGIYILPYDTSGGTVYISPQEQNTIYAGWIVAGVLVAMQLFLNLLNRPKGAGVTRPKVGGAED